MGKILLVSLVSDQTIPNIQFAKWTRKENEGKVIDLFFVSTSRMEENAKSSTIEETLQYSDFPYEQSFTVEVDPDDITDVKDTLKDSLKEIDLSQYEKIIANITGGTKLMSIAAYKFFTNIENAEIYYQSFTQKLMQLYPTDRIIEGTTNVTLVESFYANSFDAKETGTIRKSYEFNKMFYKETLKNNIDGISIIAFPGTKSIDGTFDIESSTYSRNRNALAQAKQIAETCGFNPKRMEGWQIEYVKGSWFEEYVYQHIKMTKSISDENIALSMKIERGNDKNELDVIYIDNENTVHIVECKDLLSAKQKTVNTVIRDALFKLNSVTDKFGLKVKGHIYTTATTISNACFDKAKEFGIEIVDGTMI